MTSSHRRISGVIRWAVGAWTIRCNYQPSDRRAAHLHAVELVLNIPTDDPAGVSRGIEHPGGTQARLNELASLIDIYRNLVGGRDY